MRAHRTTVARIWRGPKWWRTCVGFSWECSCGVTGWVRQIDDCISFDHQEQP